jgi:hypothetical protein
VKKEKLIIDSIMDAVLHKLDEQQFIVVPRFKIPGV